MDYLEHLKSSTSQQEDEFAPLLDRFKVLDKHEFSVSPEVSLRPLKTRIPLFCVPLSFVFCIWHAIAHILRLRILRYMSSRVTLTITEGSKWIIYRLSLLLAPPGSPPPGHPRPVVEGVLTMSWGEWDYVEEYKGSNLVTVWRIASSSLWLSSYNQTEIQWKYIVE